MRRSFNGTVRVATDEDRAEIRRILIAAFDPYTALIGRPPAPLFLDVERALAAGEVRVAVDLDDTILGFSRSLAEGHSHYVDVLAVDPAAHGRWVGQRLMRVLDQVGRDEGAAALTLYTNVAMEQALHFYARLGFTELERREEDGFARVFLSRPIAPALAAKGTVQGLFGRRRGPRFRFDTAYDTFALDLSEPPPSYVAELFNAPVERIRLEIGFGGGEHLIAHAKAAPDVGLIGAEPFETGMMQAARATTAADLANVRLHMGDAREIMDWLPPGTLDRIDILYPDPWPKPRHWKRRIISIPGLTAFHRALRPEGSIRFASDIASYCTWTRSHVAAHPGFVVESDSATPWEGWPGTRFEAKAFREGRAPTYITLKRVAELAPDLG